MSLFCLGDFQVLKTSVCPQFASASSRVVSSTADEASLGRSPLHLAAAMSMYNFLAPPSVEKGRIN